MRRLGMPTTNSRWSRLIEYAVVTLVAAAIVVGAAWFLSHELSSGLGRTSECSTCDR